MTFSINAGRARMRLLHSVGVLALAATSIVSAQTPAKKATTVAATVTAQSGALPKQSVPLAGKPKDFHAPSGRTFSLSNGMKVTLVPYGLVPKVVIQLVVRTGIIDESADETGLSFLASRMLLEGTETKTPQEIARTAASMGGSIEASADYETAEIGGEILGEFAPQFVALVGEVTRHPRFLEADFKRIVDNEVRDDAMALALPSVIASVAFGEMEYGNHPFARVYPSEKMVRGFTVARLNNFYASNFGAGRSHL